MSQLNIHLYHLYALLHDIGKPILRFAIRYTEHSERSIIADLLANNLSTLLGMNIEIISTSKHDKITDKLISKFFATIPSDVKKQIDEVVKNTDRLAASERALIVETREIKNIREFLENVWGSVEDSVTRSLGLTLRYTHHNTPMLSPLWILLETNYLEYTGLKAYITGNAGGWSGDRARVDLAKRTFEVIRAIETRNVNEFIGLVSDIIQKLAVEELWLPIRALTPSVIRDLRAQRLIDAMNNVSYSEVVSLLIEMLREVRDIYTVNGSLKFSRGLIDTLLNILRATTLLVPSAIYWSLVPDISLYSHSKIVTSYTATSLLSTGARLLVVDANAIQAFIASPVKPAAASRVMRGRSLLVELSMDSLVNYALEAFGELPSANIIVSEGGSLDIVIPDLSDFEDRIRELQFSVEKLSRYLGGILDFTIAYSNPFELKEVSFEKTIEALARSVSSGFVQVLDSLSINLATEKAKRGCRESLLISGGIRAKDIDVQDFDAITGEPVLLSSVADPFKLHVLKDTEKYANRLAPDKLGIGDYISTVTHLSLAAGSVARNLVAIIGIHAYSYEDKIPKPNTSILQGIFQEVNGRLCENWEVLLCKKSEVLPSDIALIPLIPSGSLYILISSAPEERIYDVEDPVHLYFTFNMLVRVLDALIGAIDELMPQITERTILRISIRLINAPHAFIVTETLKYLYNWSNEKYENLYREYNKLKQHLKQLMKKGFDVSLEYTFLNSYHPAVVTEGVFRLVDLDEFGVISVAKMDIDMFGEVKKLASISQSRLITISDLVNTIIAGKAYLYAVKIACELFKDNKNLDVIPLYAGGDDVTIYGKCGHVIKYLGDIYSDIRSVLKPLTISASVSTGRETEPILILYKNAIELLENYSKRVKASIIIGTPYLILYKQFKEPVNVLPFEEPDKYYSWISDEVAYWNLKLLIDIVNPFNTQLLEKLEDYKRELYILARLAGEYGEIIKQTPQPVDKLLSLEILYAYIWARRRNNLEKLKEILENMTTVKATRLYSYPNDLQKASVSEALRLLLGAKPILDLIILALRRREVVEPSPFKGE